MGIRVLNPSLRLNADEDEYEEKLHKVRISIPFGGDGGGGDPGGEGGDEGRDDDDEGEEPGQGQGRGQDRGRDRGKGEGSGESEGGEPIIIYVPGGGGPGQPWEDPPDERGPSRTEEKNLRKAVAKRVIQHRVTSHGITSSDLLTWAEKTLKPKSDWRTLLRSAIARAVVFVQGSYELSRRRPSRRSEAYPDFVMPGTAQPVPEIAVVLDVSGSMAFQYQNAPPGHNIMDQAISELDSILNSFGQMGVMVYASDVAVAWAGRVFNLSQVSITDLSGGTDLTVGINEAFKGTPRPHIIITLTDGWTDWPQKNNYQDTKIIAGIIGVSREKYEASGAKLPKFIEAIYIDD